MGDIFSDLHNEESRALYFHFSAALRKQQKEIDALKRKCGIIQPYDVIKPQEQSRLDAIMDGKQ